MPISALLEEMAALIESARQPRQFYAAFLDRLVSATQAAGGAVWQYSGERGFTLAHAHNWAALGLDHRPDATDCHLHVLEVAAQRERALWVPPNSGRKIIGADQQAANLSDHGLLLAPVLMDRQVVALIEIWTASAIDGPERRELARLLTDMAGIVGAFLHKHQLQCLLEQQQLWNRLESLTRQIHRSLDPAIVSQWIAGEGQRLLECDQLSVAIRYGAAAEIAAISGVGHIERNSKLVQALQGLAEQVLDLGTELVYRGQRDETLPVAVQHALDAYLAECNAGALIVQPLKGERDETADRCFALIAEAHDPGIDVDRLVERMRTLANHAEPALANARQVARMPLHRLSQSLATVRDWARRRRGARLGLVAIAALMVIGILTFVPMPLRLEAKGQLLPVQRQFVFAPLHGKVVELKARQGDRVDKGQELLLIEDLDSQLQIDQLAIRIAAAEQRIALLSEQIGKCATNEERNALTKDRINQEYEMHKAMAERDIVLQVSPSPRRSPVLAPLAGKVVTFDVQEQLLGKTVKPGDALLRVAAVKGIWEIELHIPERNLGPIRAGLRHSADGGVEVDLLLANQPQRIYKGRLHPDGLGGETAVKDSNVVLPARVRITDAELAKQLEAMPVGLEVRTKVHCGPRPIGQVWFYEIWEFFCEHVMF